VKMFTDQVSEERFAVLESRLPKLKSVKHPALSRVVEAFVGPPFLAELIDESDSVERFIVHEWVEGFSLAERCSTASNSEILRWCSEVGEGLDYLHRSEHGPFAHRDVHPKNVIITPEGQAVLIDYDTVLSPSSDDFKTRAVLLGTRFSPAEPSPGLEGAQRDDRWSLAKLTLYALARDTSATLRLSDARRAAISVLQGDAADPQGVVDSLCEVIDDKDPGSAKSLFESVRRSEVKRRPIRRSVGRIKVRSRIQVGVIACLVLAVALWVGLSLGSRQRVLSAGQRSNLLSSDSGNSGGGQPLSVDRGTIWATDSGFLSQFNASTGGQSIREVHVPGGTGEVGAIGAHIWVSSFCGAKGSPCLVEYEDRGPRISPIRHIPTDPQAGLPLFMVAGGQLVLPTSSGLLVRDATTGSEDFVVSAQALPGPADEIISSGRYLWLLTSSSRRGPPSIVQMDAHTGAVDQTFPLRGMKNDLLTDLAFDGHSLWMVDLGPDFSGTGTPVPTTVYEFSIARGRIVRHLGGVRQVGRSCSFELAFGLATDGSHLYISSVNYPDRIPTSIAMYDVHSGRCIRRFTAQRFGFGTADAIAVVGQRLWVYSASAIDGSSAQLTWINESTNRFGIATPAISYGTSPTGEYQARGTNLCLTFDTGSADPVPSSGDAVSLEPCDFQASTEQFWGPSQGDFAATNPNQAGDPAPQLCVSDRNGMALLLRCGESNIFLAPDKSHDGSVVVADLSGSYRYLHGTGLGVMTFQRSLKTYFVRHDVPPTE
jgi:hypothetical protein